jgi:hypothetical protein
MKKITLILLCAVFMSISVYAQSVPAAQVPSAVKKTLMTKYPKAQDVEWEKESSNYMAMFSNGEDWTEAVFTAAGVWTTSNVNIDPEKMPAALSATVKKANPGLEISGVNRIESAKGAPTYEIQLDSEDASYIAIYKADGTLVSKKQAEEESYDDEGDY